MRMWEGEEFIGVDRCRHRFQLHRSKRHIENGKYVCDREEEVRRRLPWLAFPRAGFMADPPVPMCLICCSLPRARMMLTMSLLSQKNTPISFVRFEVGSPQARNSLLLVLLGLPSLGSTDLLLSLIDRLPTLGSLGLVVSPGDLGAVGIVKLEIAGQLARRRLVPLTGRAGFVDELRRDRIEVGTD